MKKTFLEGDVFSHEMNISGDLIDSFAELSSDYSKIHMEKDFAISKGFNDRIAHGNILNLMISVLVGMKLGTQDVMLISQSIKYRHPIYEDTTIILEGVVTHFSESVNMIELKLIFYDELKKKVATGKCQCKLL